MLTKPMGSTNSRGRIVFFVLGILYLCVLSIGVHVLLGRFSSPPPTQLYSLDFGFGRLIENLVEHGQYGVTARSFTDETPEDTFLFTGHRMPVVPIFLSAVGHVSNNLLLATLVKNFVFGALLVGAFWRLRRAASSLSRLHFLLTLAYLAAIPSLMIFTGMVSVEEGYITPLLAFMFAHLISCRPGTTPAEDAGPIGWGRWVVLAACNALLFLVKSSMWPLMVMCCLFFPYMARRWVLLPLFVIFAAASFTSWGMHNQHHSGEFRVSNSWAGWCFNKGNCEHTADHYPERSIDELDHKHLVKAPSEFEDEWAYEEYNNEQAVTFIKENPGEFARLFLQKTIVMFAEVRNMPYLPAPDTVDMKKKLAGYIDLAAMVLYRIVFFGLVLAGLGTLFRKGKAAATTNRYRRDLFVVFILFCGAYACPYLIGFGYQRHAIVLVVPTFMTLLMWLASKKEQAAAA